MVLNIQNRAGSLYGTNRNTHTSDNLKGCHLLGLLITATLRDNCHPCVLDEKCIMLPRKLSSTAARKT